MYPAHYDDNDIAAAGILTRLARKGAELFYLTATDDLMGVMDVTLCDGEALNALRRDQDAAGNIIGVKAQYWLGYPDAGEYNYFDLRRDFLKYIRLLKPDFVFAPDAWLTYEGHRDHIQTGLAAAEAVMFAGLKKIASSDPSEGMDHLVQALDRKSHQVAQGCSFSRGEPLKVLHPSALHCGF